ncbi:hypothetical protein M3J09_007867 [Ascochyta lentis]
MHLVIQVNRFTNIRPRSLGKSKRENTKPSIPRNWRYTMLVLTLFYNLTVPGDYSSVCRRSNNNIGSVSREMSNWTEQCNDRALRCIGSAASHSPTSERAMSGWPA